MAQKQLFPDKETGRFRFHVDETGRVFSIESGRIHDPMEAATRLPWVRQTCPLMPHEYCVKRRSPVDAYAVLEAAVAHHPDGYKAYFRGHRSAFRYWDAPDGNRYWQTVIRGKEGTVFMLNRCPSTFEEPRKVANGAVPETWHGNPNAPDGAGLYFRDHKGRWVPSEKFLEQGLTPCASCAIALRDQPEQ